MKVFVSWSGETSHKVALLLKKRLPYILDGIDLWVSSVDIAKGARWSSEIAAQLEACNFGIFCLDYSNIQSPWVNFEAGALSKLLDEGRVAPFLTGLSPSDVTGPITQFQMTTINKDDVARLINSMNKAMGKTKNPDSTWRGKLDIFWDALEEDLKEIEASIPIRPPASTNDNEDVSKELNENEIAFLQAMANRIVGGRQQLVPTDSVAGDISITPANAAYVTQCLKDMGYLGFNSYGHPLLTNKGLTYLGDQGLL